MAITRRKEDSLVETKIVNPITDIKPTNQNKLPTETNQKPEKKSNFLFHFIKTTIVELKKVEWPALNYVISWSIVVILFASFFAIGLGFFDRIFNTGLRYVTCTSSQGENQEIQECNKEAIETITFKR